MVVRRYVRELEHIYSCLEENLSDSIWFLLKLPSNTTHDDGDGAWLVCAIVAMLKKFG